MKRLFNIAETKLVVCCMCEQVIMELCSVSHTRQSVPRLSHVVMISEHGSGIAKRNSTDRMRIRQQSLFFGFTLSSNEF